MLFKQLTDCGTWLWECFKMRREVSSRRWILSFRYFLIALTGWDQTVYVLSLFTLLLQTGKEKCKLYPETLLNTAIYCIYLYKIHKFFVKLIVFITLNSLPRKKGNNNNANFVLYLFFAKRSLWNNTKFCFAFKNDFKRLRCLFHKNQNIKMHVTHGSEFIAFQSTISHVYFSF